MKKIILFSVVVSMINTSGNTFGMFGLITTNAHSRKAFIPQKKYHTSRTNYIFEERLAEEEFYGKYFLENPEFLKKVQNNQLKELNKSFQEHNKLLHRKISIDLLKLKQQNFMCKYHESGAGDPWALISRTTRESDEFEKCINKIAQEHDKE